MFMHPMVWEADGARRLERMDRFLALAHDNGMGVGWVFFDDCWAHRGASLDPMQGCQVNAHPDKCSGGCCESTFGQCKCCMNCWVAAPQDAARTSVERFEPYVRSIVRRFRGDPRVLWFETLNEPTIHTTDSSDFAFALRLEAYKWAKAEQPRSRASRRRGPLGGGRHSWPTRHCD